MHGVGHAIVGVEYLPRFHQNGFASQSFHHDRKQRPMFLASEVFGNALVLNVAGRLDQDNCESFRRELTPHLETAMKGALQIILDLSELEYVSSAGLRCFMLAAKETKAHDGCILVAALQPMVAEIFQISRFDLLIPVFPTLRAALASVSAGAVVAFDNG